MVKAIHRLPCSPVLVACQKLMQEFIYWLCDLSIGSANITEAGCKAKLNDIEGEWIWNFLECDVAEQSLLERAKIIADLCFTDKLALAAWIHTVSHVAASFSVHPYMNLPTEVPIGKKDWKAFKTLMIAFYEKGLHQIGLPYLPNGKPTTDSSLWLNYHQFREIFRQTHRLSTDPEARDICVLCGGRMIQPAVDHWIRKAAFPLLAVCADNLLPICCECNEAPNKGEKDVHSGGSFTDWFHPYLRPGNAALKLNYNLPARSVICTPVNSTDAKKIENLNNLLNLGKRWTREFKAQHADLRDDLRRQHKEKVKASNGPLTQAEVLSTLQNRYGQLPPAKEHREVLQLLFTETSKPAGLQALHYEAILS